MKDLSKQELRKRVTEARERYDESDEADRDELLTDLLVRPYPTKISQDN